MKTYNIIEELVNTRINGNSIKNNKAYSSMLKRVTKQEINAYNDMFIGHLKSLHGTKLEMIEQIRNSEVYR